MEVEVKQEPCFEITNLTDIEPSNVSISFSDLENNKEGIEKVILQSSNTIKTKHTVEYCIVL
jgi:hypothetical protein